MSPEGQLPEPREGRRMPRPAPGQGWPRWGTWLVLGVILSLFVVGSLFTTSSDNKISYSQFLDRVRDHKVESVSLDNSSHNISGVDKDGTHFKVNGPVTLLELALRESSEAVPASTCPSGVPGTPCVVPAGPTNPYPGMRSPASQEASPQVAVPGCGATPALL